MVEKQRHWLLTTWLIILLLISFIKAWYSFAYLPADIHVYASKILTWYSYTLGIIAIGTMLSVVALLRWSIWGFWGYCFFKIIEIYLKLTFYADSSVYKMIIVQIVFVIILYLLLNMGGEKKAWKQLTY